MFMANWKKEIVFRHTFLSFIELFDIRLPFKLNDDFNVDPIFDSFICSELLDADAKKNKGKAINGSDVLFIAISRGLYI